MDERIAKMLSEKIEQEILTEFKKYVPLVKERLDRVTFEGNLVFIPLVIYGQIGRIRFNKQRQRFDEIGIWVEDVWEDIKIPKTFWDE